MPRPVEINRASHFRYILRRYDTVFAMFYQNSRFSTESISAFFRSLCASYSDPTVVFVKIEHGEIPGLAVEHDIPRELAFAVFVNGRKVDVVTGPDRELLRRLVHRYADSATSEAARHTPRSSVSSSPDGRFCGLYNRRQPSRRSSSARSNSDSGPSSSSPERVPLEFNWPDMHRTEPGRYVPARLIHVQQRGSATIARPARFEYQGQDGQTREASVYLERRGDGPALTYLDRSGPIPIERDIGR